MEITREIGLRYLWIDSLCIVQGDHEEWLRESEKMGSVYENAYLVVAAADARDSTEGCFIESARSPRLEIVKIPYVQPSGEPLGSLYAGDWSEETFQDPDENKSLLSTRAWITQEWILARRIVFYTREGIVWSCRTIRSPPSGVNEISHRSELSDWWSLIQTHSSRNLTYFTDRLISLDGIRTEVQKRDHTVYKFGMFEKDLQTQLLWLVCPESHAARPDQSPIPAPSWSWVSRTSSIQFFKDWSMTGPYRDERDKIDCGDVFFEDDVVVITDGTVMKLHPADWDPTTERSRTNIFRRDSDTSTTESETNEQDEDQAAKGLEITDHEEEHTSWYSDIEPDSSVDYYDSYPYILFDDGNIPSQDAGPLFAVYLTRKYLVWPHDKEVQYEQYFIVLEPCLEGPADTYTRVGAGWIANDVRRGLRFQSEKKRRIRIV
ncbi:uncharacterized protein FTJAE_685 [Fusarium tjaetaba]|uniref:Heterokaryon incompatibility domain-containing protein n=1 Tax=Fusarium tjaetaba TaxID=1567544 RepID=A0A8H5W9C4_9HYPO|nr:uncharacterized protein FTJAE_685 [Fusarium tjaetaba]KAF5650120.1 hypothetical protein FTJAE_685 [Fusarium tjaetaba]